MNQRLKCIFRSSFGVITKKPGVTEVRQKPCDSSVIASLYHELCDVIDMINSSLASPIVFVVLYLFILNLFSCYTLVWTLFKEPEYLFMVLTTDGSYVMFNNILQAIFIYASTSTTKQAEQTVLIIIKIIYNNECNKDQLKTFKFFLSQTHHRKLKFETSFFTIDWKLLLVVRSTETFKHPLIMKNRFRLYQPQLHI